MSHAPEEKAEWKGVVGIQNMGNTCYANTTLQLLRACPEWTVFCIAQPLNKLMEHLPAEDSNKKILLAYQDILKSLWSAYRPAYVRPLGFISEVKKAVAGTVYEMFSQPIQNDSHEYLVYLLDHFHEALKTTSIYVERPVTPNMSPIDRMRCLAENGWESYYSKNKSEIVRLFFGMTRKSIECLGCHAMSYQWEVFNSLKIPCEGATFYEWIRNEINETTQLDDYQCNGCRLRRPARIQSHLWKLPQNLLVTLRRFHYDGRKNMTPCPYGGDVISFQDFYADESDDPYRQSLYEIRSVSDHHGSHLGGHYTAQFKHPLTGEWWWLDDQVARPLAGFQPSPSNYIFYFRRVKS
jgi:ubiquitin C-terminal hydrolase